MSFLNIFKLSYYFDSQAGSTFPGYWVVLGLAVVALVASVIAKKRSEKMSYSKREVIQRITGPLFIASWIFLLWMFLRYEGIVYLSWRLWPLFIFIYLVISGILLYRFTKVTLPEKRERSMSGDDTKQHYLRRFAGKGRAGGSKKK